MFRLMLFYGLILTEDLLIFISSPLQLIACVIYLLCFLVWCQKFNHIIKLSVDGLCNMHHAVVVNSWIYVHKPSVASYQLR